MYSWYSRRSRGFWLAMREFEVGRGCDVRGGIPFSLDSAAAAAEILASDMTGLRVWCSRD